MYSLAASPDFAAVVEQAAGGRTILFPRDDGEEAKAAAIAECEILLHATGRLTRPVIDAAPNLRLVVHQGVGFQDTIDWQALHARGIRLTLTPAGTFDTVAEHTVLLTMAVQRHLIVADRELRAGRFLSHALRLRSTDLVGKTVGLVGMGRIAEGAARRFRPFGTDILYTNRSSEDPRLLTELGARRVSLPELLAKADIVSLHLPLTPETQGIIDSAALAAMKPGAILINTARGGLVDERALVAALQSGYLAGAGLDAFAHEPVPADHPLLALDTVVLTPHCGAGTIDALRRKLAAMFDNVRRFEAGEPLHDEVDLS